jgi:peptidoglycan L-alanyl-D-glutamate endopeptidase CwlK
MTYTLGKKSLAVLDGVHPNLARCVKQAITVSKQDFGVHEGLRSPQTQAEYLRRGVTKTAKSKHLKQADGYSHAVDLVPYIDGVLRWEWPLIYPIATAMRAAAIGNGIRLRWGGVWDFALNDLPSGLEGAVRGYVDRHPGPDFLDGPHYELTI